MVPVIFLFIPALFSCQNMEKRRLVGWGGSGNYLFLSGFSSSRNAPSHQAKNRGHSRSKLRGYQHHCKYAPSRYLPPCDHYHNEYQYYCHDHCWSLLAIFGRRSFCTLASCEWECFLLLVAASLYSFIFLTIDGIAGFLCSSGDIFQEGRKKGKYISFSDTASPHFMASNTNNILFGNGAIVIAEESHIQGEFSFYTHPITHTHTLFAEPHLMLIKIVPSNFFTTCRLCMCDMCCYHRQVI